MSRQTLILGAVLVLGLGGAYWYFFTGTPTQPLSATTVATSPAEQQFLDLAGKLTPVSFDTKIFTDPRFTTLINLATPIAPELVGRNDPFAPLGR